jgi:hypothetical protein
MKKFLNFLNAIWIWMKGSSLFWAIIGAFSAFLFWIIGVPKWIIAIAVIFVFLYLLYLEIIHHAWQPVKTNWTWFKNSSLFWTIFGAALTFFLWIIATPKWIIVILALVDFIYLIYLDIIHHTNQTKQT